jgi:hypothetical protein
MIVPLDPWIWNPGTWTTKKIRVRDLTLPGERVVDPAEGSRAWAEPVARAGRRLIGCDRVAGGSTS